MNLVVTRLIYLAFDLILRYFVVLKRGQGQFYTIFQQSPPLSIWQVKKNGQICFQSLFEKPATLRKGWTIPLLVGLKLCPALGEDRGIGRSTVPFLPREEGSVAPVPTHFLPTKRAGQIAQGGKVLSYTQLVSTSYPYFLDFNNFLKTHCPNQIR